VHECREKFSPEFSPTCSKRGKTAVFANPLELKGKRLKVKISTQKPDKISVFKYRYLPLKCGVFR